MKKITATALIIGGLAFALSRTAGYEQAGNAALLYFLPGELLIFLFAFYLSQKLGPLLEQPPLMIFLLTMVVKMLACLTLFLVYLVKGYGPANEGALAFILIYLVFEIQEIKRFLSILRPDSGRDTLG